MLKKIEITDREDWLQKRRSFIGASEIGSVLGINPHKSPLGVYWDKTNEHYVSEENEFTQAGHILEPLIAQQFEIQYPEYKLEEDLNIYYNDDFPHLSCTLDRLILFNGERISALECKASFKPSLWRNGLPGYYNAQVQQQMLVMGFEWQYLAVLFPETDLFKVFKVQQNIEFQKMLIEKSEKFWKEYVVPRKQPEPSSVDDCRELYKTYIPGNYVSVEDNPGLEDCLRRLKNTRDQIAVLEEDEKHQMKMIMEILKESEYLLYKGEKIVTWRSGKESSMVDSKLLQQRYPEIYTEVSKSRANGRKFLFKDNLIK